MTYFDVYFAPPLLGNIHSERFRGRGREATASKESKRISENGSGSNGRPSESLWCISPQQRPHNASSDFSEYFFLRGLRELWKVLEDMLLCSVRFRMLFSFCDFLQLLSLGFFCKSEFRTMSFHRFLRVFLDFSRFRVICSCFGGFWDGFCRCAFTVFICY